MIVDRLTQIRRERDIKMANRARAHYGEEFKNIFCYKKSGSLFVKTNDRDIAKQFQQELAKQGLPPGDVTNDAGFDMDLDSEWRCLDCLPGFFYFFRTFLSLGYIYLWYSQHLMLSLSLIKSHKKKTGTNIS